MKKVKRLTQYTGREEDKLPEVAISGIVQIVQGSVLKAVEDEKLSLDKSFRIANKTACLVQDFLRKFKESTEEVVEE
jgi:hypothetical protein